MVDGRLSRGPVTSRMLRLSSKIVRGEHSLVPSLARDPPIRGKSHTWTLPFVVPKFGSHWTLRIGRNGTCVVIFLVSWGALSKRLSASCIDVKTPAAGTCDT